MTNRPLRSGFLAAIIVCAWSAAALAQGTTLHVVVEGRWHRGTLLSASPRGLALQTDNGNLQLRFHRDSIITVRGTGDPGFLKVGAVVQVSGQLNGKTLEDADISVHVNPKATARPGVVTLYSDSKELSVKGRVMNLNPLTIKTIDMVQLEVKSQNVSVPTPPTSAGKVIAVSLKNPTPDDIPLVLAYNLRLAQKGDPVYVFVADRKPGFVRNATITRAEPLKSQAAARAESAAKTQAGPENGEKTPEAGNVAAKPKQP